MNPTEHIDRYIARHADWRGDTVAQVRRVVRAAVPDVTEEWKWMGTPTWSRNGILCICNAFKDMVKVTFIDGAKLEDPTGVFNAELGGNRWRAIKLFQGDRVNEAGLTTLLLAAVALNESKTPRKPRGPARKAPPPASRPKKGQRPAKRGARTSRSS
jgi:hypothetical protein